MKTASYFLTPEVAQLSTQLYQKDGVTAFPYWHIIYRPAGAINASAEDMASYVRFLLNRGSVDGIQLLPTTSIDQMERPSTLPAAQLGEFAGYGLYNYVSFEKGFEFHGHNGGVSGGLTEMAYCPRLGRGYAFMINAAKGDAMGKISRLLKSYIIQGSTAPTPPSPSSVPIEIQRRYSGYYQPISPRVQMAYFVERLMGVQRMHVDEHGLWSASWNGKHRTRWVAVTERLFRKEKEPKATLALLPQSEDGTVIQSFGGTLKKVSGLRVWGQAVTLVLVQLFMISSVLFAFIWGIRKLLGKLPNPGPLAVRSLPLIATLLFYASLAMIALGAQSENLFVIMGSPTVLTISIMMTTLAFALVSAASLAVVYRARSVTMNRFAYWHSAAVAVATAISAGYFLYWGMIGVRIWAV
jgi:hypothetical protein